MEDLGRRKPLSFFSFLSLAGKRALCAKVQLFGFSFAQQPVLTTCPYSASLVHKPSRVALPFGGRAGVWKLVLVTGQCKFWSQVNQCTFSKTALLKIKLIVLALLVWVYLLNSSEPRREEVCLVSIIPSWHLCQGKNPNFEILWNFLFFFSLFFFKNIYQIEWPLWVRHLSTLSFPLTIRGWLPYSV